MYLTTLSTMSLYAILCLIVKCADELLDPLGIKIFIVKFNLISQNLYKWVQALLLAPVLLAKTFLFGVGVEGSSTIWRQAEFNIVFPSLRVWFSLAFSIFDISSVKWPFAQLIPFLQLKYGNKICYHLNYEID